MKAKKLTPLKAIHEKCFDCGYDEHDKGSKHQQIESCIDTDCALHEYRPITGKLKEKLKKERIANYSPEELALYKQKQETARIRLAGK